MTYILAFLAGVAGTIAGYVLATAFGVGLALVLGMSNFEGASGYFAAFVVGPIGGLIGLFLGLWLVLRYKGGYRSFSAIAGRSAIVVIAIALATYAGVQLWESSLENFPGGLSPQLDFEIRLPAASPPPNRKKIDFEMQAGSQRSGGLLRDNWLRYDGDRPVLVGFVRLATRTSKRALVVSLPDQPKLIFWIRLSATPAVSERFGEWQRVDALDNMKADSAPRPPTTAENFEIRYRVPEWRQP